MRRTLTPEMTAIRQQEIADGTCPAEQLTKRDIRILQTDIPWTCSLDAGHHDDHEVYVDYVFTDGREPQRAVKVHSWPQALAWEKKATP